MVGVCKCGLDTGNECPDRGLELRLRNSKYRIVLLESVRVDRDVVSLWRLSNPDGPDTVEEVHGPPHRRASDIRSVDEFGDHKLRVVGVSEQAENVVCGTARKNIGLLVGIRIDTDCYILFCYFRHCLILRNKNK